MAQHPNIGPAGGVGEVLYSVTTSGISVVHRTEGQDSGPNTSLQENGRSATQHKE